MKTLALLLATPFLLSAIPYEVNWVGLDDEKVLNSLRDAADLMTLQERPPASMNGIRYRIAGDIPEMIKVLKTYGYYDATISSDLSLEENSAEVTIFIHAGPQYSLSSYEVFHGNECNLPLEIPCCPPFSPELLGLKIGAPALSIHIVNAELTLLSELAKCGYPLASVEKRQVIVDMQSKQMQAAACVDEGPLSKFGPITIFGLKGVNPRFVFDKIAWQEGEIYRANKIEKTQKRLLDSDLFSSVLISHDGKLDENGQLPIKMRLSEAKHRQIALGVFYATVDGPGAMFSWTHRNFRALGESINLNGEFSKRYLAGTLTYKKPDFFIEDQTLRAVGQIERQDIKAFTAFVYRFASFLDRKMDNRRNFSIGLEIQHLNVNGSANDGTYNLLDLPIFARYNAADELLNPTQGYSIVYQPHFFQSLDRGQERFIKQRLTTTFYIPLIKKWFIFAGRFQVGSITGTKQKNIPLPHLFLGGSEDDLRGYRYLTVSPLNDDDKPLGGRSAIFLTLEPRFRFGNIGIVPFADFGTVAFSELPTVNIKWFKSLGLGLRYFAFFGPLRFDIGFPLDRRSIDPAFRMYGSIGQTF